MLKINGFMRNVPGRVLFWLGTPFHFNPDSNISQWDETKIRSTFKNAQWEHYVPRVIAIVAFLVLIAIQTVIAVMTGFSSISWTIIILLGVALFFFLIDMTVKLARDYHLRMAPEVAEKTGTELSTFVKEDSDLDAIIKRTREEKKARETVKDEHRRSV